MEEIFFQISVVLIAGTFFATLAKFLKQPMIPAYIIAGIILGPLVFHVIDSHSELMETLSSFGIAFLLFLVGIELDIRKFLKSGKVAVIIGVAQMAFAVGIGWIIIRLLGFESASAFFLAIALGFSSTIVVLKLLGEKKELDTLHSQIAIGLMLTQDFIAILFLIFFDVFAGDAGGNALMIEIIMTILKGGVLIGASLLSARYILKHVFLYFARSSELLFLGSISWCLIFAILAGALGFSIEVGSLLAGVSLSFVPYSVEISYRIKSLRDFFLPIFFSVLGAQLVFSGGLMEVFIPATVLSLLVLLASPIVVIGLLLGFGYRASTSFKVGAAIGQVSEFSFVVVAMGYAQGVIGQDIVSLVALIGLITMTLSTYIISYSDQLYHKFAPFIKRWEKEANAVELEYIPQELKKHVVIFGYHTMGFKAHSIVKKHKKQVLVVDNNPDVIKKLRHSDIPHVYGSISDAEVLEHAAVSDASVIISTVPKLSGNIALLDYLAQSGVKRKKVIVTAFDVDDALRLYDAGASYVIYPTSLSAEHIDVMLDGALAQKKKAHIQELHKIQELYGRI